MPHPKNKMRTPGHARVVIDGRAACTCGWRADPGRSLSQADKDRGQHLVDVRMDLLP
jgi:hypothetical protein